MIQIRSHTHENGHSVRDVSSILLGFINQDNTQHPLDVILSQHSGCLDKFQGFASGLQTLIRQCLILDPAQRPGPSELLTLDIFSDMEHPRECVEMYMFSGRLRCEHLETPTQDTELPEHMLAERSLQEVSICAFLSRIT